MSVTHQSRRTHGSHGREAITIPRCAPLRTYGPGKWLTHETLLQIYKPRSAIRPYIFSRGSRTPRLALSPWILMHIFRANTPMTSFEVVVDY